MRQLKLIVRRAPFKTSEDLRSDILEHCNVAVHASTIRHYLLRLKLKCRKAKRKPLLNAFQRRRRLIWAKKLLQKRSSFWRRCIFSDEMRIELLQGNVSENVYRLDGEADLPQHIRPTVKHSPAVTIWGCFSHKGVGKLRFIDPKQAMNSAWYRDVLQKEVCATLHDQFGGVQYAFFQDDGAPCHIDQRQCRKNFSSWE